MSLRPLEGAAGNLGLRGRRAFGYTVRYHLLLGLILQGREGGMEGGREGGRERRGWRGRSKEGK